MNDGAHVAQPAQGLGHDFSVLDLVLDDEDLSGGDVIRWGHDCIASSRFIAVRSTGSVLAGRSGALGAIIVRMSMDPATRATEDVRRDRSGGVVRVGCVSYLNAKPLIHGLEGAPGGPGVSVEFDVPSGLLGDLEAGRTDLALCPIVDYHRSRAKLEIVPAGAIGCLGQTLTVKLLSQTPFDRVERVHVDTHSHTSVVLMRLILAMRYGRRPDVEDYRVVEPRVGCDEDPACLLLIGDKVVQAASTASMGPQASIEASPSESHRGKDILGVRYPYQLDLGQAWHELTGMGFVFAAWMTRVGHDLGDAPAALAAVRQRNAQAIGQIASIYGPRHGWPVPLAEHYLRNLMRYDLGPAQLEAIQCFGRLALEHSFLDRLEPIRLRDGVPETKSQIAASAQITSSLSTT